MSETTATPKPKRAIPGMGILICILVLVVVILAALVCIVPFVTLLVLVNMLCHKGKISFIPAPKQRVKVQKSSIPKLNFD